MTYVIIKRGGLWTFRVMDLPLGSCAISSLVRGQVQSLIKSFGLSCEELTKRVMTSCFLWSASPRLGDTRKGGIPKEDLARVAIFFACYRGHLGPSGPKSKKSPKLGSRGREGQKSRKRVEKESKIDYFWTFSTLFRLFFDFSTPGAERPREPIFWLFFGLWARRAQMTPVAGEEDRNEILHKVFVFHRRFWTPTQRARRGILMTRGKNCRETIFAAQLPRNCPHHGGNFERGRNVLYCGGEAIWEAF